METIAIMVDGAVALEANLVEEAAEADLVVETVDADEMWLRTRWSQWPWTNRL